MLRTITPLILLLTLTASCATPAYHRFVTFPTQGQDQNDTLTAQAECQAIAEGKRGPEAQDAILGGLATGAVGAGVGAATGAIVGAIFRGVGQSSLAGAAIGGAFGLISGVASVVQANRERTTAIFVKCLEARGFKVAG